MKVVAQLLRLRPGRHDEYKRRHDQLWPELAARLHELGVKTTIFAYQDLLFAYATAPDDAAWEALARDPVTRRWDEYMADLLETDEQGVPAVVDLPIVFQFDNSPS